jgi:digalactosyldiacylglycerol synthase
MKKINIITTAAIPWFTGTSINPLWRAIYLARSGYQVRLYLPWIKTESQRLFFPNQLIFKTQEEQRNYIFSWINNGNHINQMDILFYQAEYISPLKSIYSKQKFKDIIKPCDILILEEPEHLLTFQPLAFFNFNQKGNFKVIGIIHTNYEYYLSRMVVKFLSKISSVCLRIFNNFIIKNNCEISIRLSAAVPKYKNSVICNVNGVPERYFNRINQVDLQNKTYFIGKLIWEKGLKELVDLCLEACLYELDIYGDGKSRQDIITYSNSKGLNFNFLEVLSSSEKSLAKYKIFINPSVSEVMCTTTSEALAMGKFVIIPKHVSNEFFYSFLNCLTYENSADFKRVISYALNNQPKLNDESLAKLSWHMANERLLKIIDPTCSGI